VSEFVEFDVGDRGRRVVVEVDDDRGAAAAEPSQPSEGSGSP